MKRLSSVLLISVVVLASITIGATTIQLPNGATSQSLVFKLLGATGEPNAATTIANLDLYVMQWGDQQSKVCDLAALGSAVAAWDDEKAYHLGNGDYRVDVPDANLADGVGKHLTYLIFDAAATSKFSWGEVVVELVDSVPPVDVTTWNGTAVKTPKTAGVPAVEVNEIDGYAVNAGAAMTVAAAIGQTATAAANIEIVYATDFATNYSTTLDKWKVDVNSWTLDTMSVATVFSDAFDTSTDQVEIGTASLDRITASVDANCAAVDAVLANSAQGGAAAVLTLDSIIVSNADGVGVSITGTTDGVLVTGTAGDGIHALSSGSNGNGLTLAGNGTGADLAADSVASPTDINDAMVHGDAEWGASGGFDPNATPIMLQAADQTKLGYLTDNVATAASLTAGVAQLDTAIADVNNTLGVAGAGLSAIPGMSTLSSGTAQSGTSSTIVLAAATASTVDLKGALIFLTGGTGAGQYKMIAEYAGATDTATIFGNWAVTPGVDSTYVIWPTTYFMLDQIRAKR